jgi:hypothetical protein
MMGALGVKDNASSTVSVSSSLFSRRPLHTSPPSKPTSERGTSGVVFPLSETKLSWEIDPILLGALFACSGGLHIATRTPERWYPRRVAAFGLTAADPWRCTAASIIPRDAPQPALSPDSRMGAAKLHGGRPRGTANRATVMALTTSMSRSLNSPLRSLLNNTDEFAPLTQAGGYVTNN